MNSKGSISILVILGIIFSLLFVVGAYFLDRQFPGTNLQSDETYVKFSPQPVPSSKVNLIEQENFKAITADIKLSYFFNPGDNQNLIYRQVDFKTNTSKDIYLPYFNSQSSDEAKTGRYKVSPDGKYIIRLTRNLLEIAELANPKIFRTVHKVEPIIHPPGNGINYSHLDDAMWDKNGNLFFITGVGLDAIGAPPEGVYTDLYVAKEDGSNVKLVNDHTKADQQIGFMKDFAYIDSGKNEIYLGGSSHGGHIATMIIVDAQTGKLKRRLQDIYTDLANPVFNKDFSKAYYEQDIKEEGYLNSVKIYEYDVGTSQKKLLYSVPNATGDSLSNQISEHIYLDQQSNKLYFQATIDKIKGFYMIDLATSEKPTLLFNNADDCERVAISEDGDFVFLKCRDMDARKYIFKFYQVSTKKEFKYYSEDYSNDDWQPNIEVIDFE